MALLVSLSASRKQLFMFYPYVKKRRPPCVVLGNCPLHPSVAVCKLQLYGILKSSRNKALTELQSLLLLRVWGTQAGRPDPRGYFPLLAYSGAQYPNLALHTCRGSPSRDLPHICVIDLRHT
jgi:hypothetical protein